MSQAEKVDKIQKWQRQAEKNRLVTKVYHAGLNRNTIIVTA